MTKRMSSSIEEYQQISDSIMKMADAFMSDMMKQRDLDERSAALMALGYVSGLAANAISDLPRASREQFKSQIQSRIQSQ